MSQLGGIGEGVTHEEAWAGGLRRNLQGGERGRQQVMVWNLIWCISLFQMLNILAGKTSFCECAAKMKC